MINRLRVGLTVAASAVLFPAVASASGSSACTGATAVGASCTGGGLTDQLGDIINAIFLIIGIISVIVILYGAIRYITSTGDAKRIQAAKDTIIYALAGLIVAILARAIVGFVISRFGA